MNYAIKKKCIDMTKQCVNCSKTFQIFPEDQEFYTRINVPEPTLCPDCRNQRRLMFRQERHMYRRECDLCHKSIVSVYPADSPYTVYCTDCWWSDRWDPLNYGQVYDSTRPFFDQFNELLRQVPRVALVGSHNENSEYVSYSNYMKNCYLVYGGHDTENAMYTWRIYHSKDCVDCAHVAKTELSYYVIDSENVYNSRFIYNCQGVTDSAFLYDCNAVQHCFMSTNLRTAQYVFKNQQLTQSEYERAVAKYDLGSQKTVITAWQEFQDLFTNKALHVAVDAVHSEAVIGNNFFNCHNCYYGFALKESDNNRYVFYGEHLTDSMDTVLSGWPAELLYETMSVALESSNVKCSSVLWNCTNAEYSDNCHDSADLFGAAGLRHGKYVILNRQYSQTDYVQLREQIIQDMRARQEYGEFFPAHLSPYAYNETLANDFYPLTETDVRQRGWKWKDELPHPAGEVTLQALPDHISKASNTITEEMLACVLCHRNYKIIPPELAFYRQTSLALPRLCPNCRLLERLRIRNPLALWHRQCMCTQLGHKHSGRCATEFDTSYSPDRKEIVYCEICYQKEIY